MVTRIVTISSPAHYGRRVPSRALGGLLKAIPEAIRRSVRMAVEGRSRGRGKRPDWLNAATDIRYLGHDGSDQTALHFDLPTLGEAAPRLYQQREFWPTRPDAEDTGFDLLGDVLYDVASQNADSDRFDRTLLDAIADFRVVLNGEFAELTWNRREAGVPVSLTPTVAETARTLYTNTPLPRQVRIVGRLDMVRASTSSFAVILDAGDEVRGVLSEGEIGALSALLNRRVLILGRASYKPSGRLLRVDAQQVSPTSDNSSFFSAVPKPTQKKLDLRDTFRNQQHKLGVAAIFGKWPGDETDEEVADALRGLR